MEIQVVKIYKKLPFVFKSSDGKLYQCSYFDRKGRFRAFKELIPREHNKNMYYRIDGKRYSEWKLLAMESKSNKRINLNKL